MAKLSLRFGLRAKLLVFSSFLFAIPYLGYQYVWELETYLRIGQEQTLVGTARSVATVLHERPALFAQESAFLQSVRPNKDLYAHDIKAPIRLDGQLRDWTDYSPHVLSFGSQQLIAQNVPYQAESFRFDHMVGQFDRYLYVMFAVVDEAVVYRKQNTLSIHKNDFIQVAMLDEFGQFTRYVVAPYAPGWVNAYKVALTEDDNPAQRFRPVELTRAIQGYWRETSTGYQVELRFPLSMMSGNIAFAISDVDNESNPGIKYTIGTANPEQADALGTVVVPSPELEQIIKGLEYADARVWVVDKHQRVLARAGDIQSAGKGLVTEPDDKSWWGQVQNKILRPLYYQFLTKPSDEYIDELQDAVALEGQEVRAALQGEANTLWRISRDNKAVIISAAHPIFVAGEVFGAVVVEQTTHGIRTLRNQALEKQFNFFLAVIVFGTLALFLLASRISWRIRKLRNDTEQAIDRSGKIIGSLSVQDSHDEIGDLSRGFAQVLGRLSQYNHYLENMAARLSHEIRTPVAVVKSSLENLELIEDKNSEQAHTFVHRAKEGLARLSLILHSMSEATRLEQVLQGYQKSEVDLVPLLEHYVHGLNAYSATPVELHCEPKTMLIQASPDLLTQMLDKVTSNAMDFAFEGSTIDIYLRGNGAIEVVNTGPSIKAAMKEELFNLMVSVRDKNTDALHLGLGLYMAKLIAEFHEMAISIDNGEQANQVVVRIEKGRE